MKMLEMIPPQILASGWIPFTVFVLLSLVFSVIYVLWYAHNTRRTYSSIIVSVFALTVTLMTSALVPLDVFLISIMKTSDGTFKPWASDPIDRNDLENGVLIGYYAFYSLILLFAFLLLPFVFFFHMEPIGDDDDDVDDEEYQDDLGRTSTTSCSRMIRALKYTALSVAVLIVLIVIGLFLPLGDDHGGRGAYDLKSRLTMDYVVSHHKNLITFLLEVLNVVGMIFLVFYTGYGLSSLPIGMIKGQRTVHTRREAVVNQLEALEEQIKAIQDRYEGQNIPYYEQNALDRLEQQARLLKRTDRYLEQNARSCINRIIYILRPFQVLFGAFFGLCGALIFTSLAISCLDKALHSQGMHGGYVLINNTFPNPTDMILVYAQHVFPLDYILYSGMILFFVFCSMSGVKNIGIRFLWIPLYKIRTNKTKPQGLILMCLILIYIILALNVVMYSVVPDYTTYGSQKYQFNVTDKATNVTTVEIRKCADKADADECVMSQISKLLTAFHEKAWIFGALYFWLDWILLFFILLGSLVSICMTRRPSNRSNDDQNTLINEEDEEGDNSENETISNQD